MPWTLLYADDVRLASEETSKVELKTQAWSDLPARFGLLLNLRKTEYLTTVADELGTINVHGVDLPRNDVLKYFG